MRSRRSGSGWPSGDTRVFGRRVTSKAPSAHVEGGSGHSEASPTAILKDTHSVEGGFCELRLEGVLGRRWSEDRLRYLPDADQEEYLRSSSSR